MSALAPRTLTRRERVMAIGAIVVVTAVLGYVYLAEPYTTELIAVRTEAVARGEELARLRALMENRDLIEKNYREFRKAAVSGPDETSLQVQLFTKLESLAKGNGLSVRSIKPLSVGREGKLHRLRVQLSALGEHHEFVQFLHALQLPENVLRAEAFTMQAGRGQPPITLTITVSQLVDIRSDGDA